MRVCSSLSLVYFKVIPSNKSATMSVSIDVSYIITFDNSPPWKVAKDNVKTVNGDSFVRLRPYDTSFVKFIVDSMDVQMPKGRCTLANTEGFKSLLQARNDAGLSPLEESPDKASDACASAAGLFGGDIKDREPKRKARFNASKLQELRQSPDVMEVEAPPSSFTPALRISMIKPVHPCD